MLVLTDPNSVYIGDKEPCPYGKEGVFPECFGMFGSIIVGCHIGIRHKSRKQYSYYLFFPISVQFKILSHDTKRAQSLNRVFRFS